MIFNRQGHCLFTNRKGFSLMKLSEHETIGKSFGDIWPEELHEKIDFHVNQVLDGKQSSFSAYRTDGIKKTWWSISLSPIYNKKREIEWFISLGADITVHKHAEETIKRSAVELEQKISERTYELRD